MTRRLLQPRSWTPPPLDDPGRTAPLRVQRLLPTGGRGPEDVVFDHAGRIVTGLGDGRIVRIDPATGERTVLAETGGRPLGLHPRADGGVLVCDHDRGLLEVRPDGTVQVLADTVDGEPLTFASNVVESRDGTIWFTTSTSRWDLADHLGDIVEHSCTGRLVRRDPDGAVRTVLPELKFGNGLVLTPDESALLVAETAGYRIRRHHLSGPAAGRTEVLVEGLAGFPDNMWLGSDGLLWVAIAAPRNPLIDRLLPGHGLLRTLVWNLPEAVRPKAAPIAWVMAFDLDGRRVHDLRATDGSYGFVTSVAERDGVLVAGSLTATDIAVLAL
ncbi:sugar lactone lactonase YvrE [Actinoplanes octamycinicus]|uniref:Sugar lactone lactonase YvrE n=2 Tax=Actinoplanes octamycinicus TaxID=135948 RepID=A0A7W7H1T9_9ACTN|nr:SMP-30/gluconolactonase/LRE family protein [Actinoplanes octamycinicus]MBB4742421.1 sugar lactone lactonase YvrE [Actinoplanes octamycinicus]GIE62330.1 strictosidine synthase family protein [Actinoplanes octamycinicus]